MTRKRTEVRLHTLRTVAEAVDTFHPTKASHEDIARIVDCAADLVDALYAREDTSTLLFYTRKAIEGVFGHDGPMDDEEWLRDDSEDSSFKNYSGPVIPPPSSPETSEAADKMRRQVEEAVRKVHEEKEKWFINRVSRFPWYLRGYLVEIAYDRAVGTLYKLEPRYPRWYQLPAHYRAIAKAFRIAKMLRNRAS